MDSSILKSIISSHRRKGLIKSLICLNNLRLIRDLVWLNLKRSLIKCRQVLTSQIENKCRKILYGTIKKVEIKFKFPIDENHKNLTFNGLIIQNLFCCRNVKKNWCFPSIKNLFYWLGRIDKFLFLHLMVLFCRRRKKVVENKCRNK